jgi:Domain of unknown function (DUF4278)
MMKYRGVTYSVENPSVDMVETNRVGQLSHLPVPQPILRMTYRGVPYETTVTGSVAASIAARAIPKTATQRQQDTQQVHRHHLLNLLQHRLDVARGKGDAGLVQQLEQEMRVLH